METTNHQRIHILFRAMLLCLCAALLAGGAFAEETKVVNLGGLGMCRLRYQETLPDGRILLAGYQRTPDDAYPVPRLLCLNNDRTVSWDYLDTADKNAGYTHAAVLADGTIGVVLEKRIFSDIRNSSVDLRFFTQDGEPTGKEITILAPADGIVTVMDATKSGLDLLTRIEKGETVEYLPNRLAGWDGIEISQVNGLSCSAVGTQMIEEPDGLLMYGLSPGQSPFPYGQHGVMWKMDPENHLVWQEFLPYTWPDTVSLSVQYYTAAGDGGYLGILSESQNTPPLVNEYVTMLVRLDREGNTLWMKNRLFEGIRDYLQAIGQYGGIYAAVFRNDNWTDEWRPDNHLTICWFDENGVNLGTAGLELKPEDFDWLADCAPVRAGKIVSVEMQPDTRLIPMEDGLWLAADIYVQTERNDEEFGSVYAFETDSCRSVLIRIPEP